MTTKDCVLITGAAGFIGTALRRELETELPIIGIDSFVLDVHPFGTRDTSQVNVHAMYSGNVQDPELLNKVLSSWNPKTVIHLAAETGTGVSALKQSLHMSSNALGTARLLEALEINNCSTEKIILSSSRAVYGDGLWAAPDGTPMVAMPRTLQDLTSGQWRPRSRAGEILQTPVLQSASQMPNPANVYALSKYAQEKLVEYWCDRRGVSYQILRFQNVYGPGQSAKNPYTGIVNVFGNAAAAGQSIPVYEDGLITRDFIYIDDIISGITSVLKDHSNQSGTYDLGSSQAVTVLDLARLVAELTFAPEPTITKQFRYGDVRAAVSSPDNRPSAWLPRVDLREGLQRTLEWLAIQSA